MVGAGGRGGPANSRFAPDPLRAARNADLLERHGKAFPAVLAEAMTGDERDARHPAAVVPSARVSELVTAFDLHGPEEAALLALASARALARAPVSGYRVGAVGVVPEGDLVLGGNLELPGASIWQTVHAEGFVTLVARARGTRVATLALSQARPCAHCRQVLAEMDGAHDLALVDLAGRRLGLDDVYPWPFAPGDLDVAPAAPAAEAFPFLALEAGDLPGEVAETLLAAGRRAHASYSGSPAACVLRLDDGTVVPGTVLESVAFNPTIGPVQDALVGVLAAGRSFEEIAAAWVAVGRGAQVGHEAVARDALAAAIPGVPVDIRYWG